MNVVFFGNIAIRNDLSSKNREKGREKGKRTN